MAADAKETVKKLLTNPYEKVFLQDYQKTLSNRRNRKKLEEIEKELSWYNGKAVKYKVEDRQGFFKHFQENYGSERMALSTRYRSICDYPSGQEPKLLYFVMLFVKRHQEIQEFQSAHPITELRGSLALSLEYKKLVNEFRLLSALLERLSGLMERLIQSIDECFVTDYLKDAETLPLGTLQNRFYRAIRLPGSADVSEKLLELIKKAGATDTAYMEAMVCLKKKDYAKALEAVSVLKPDHPSYAAAKAMSLECCANLGKIQEFIDSFRAVSDTKIDAMYFIYMLQVLVCNADYKELDTDEFENSIQELLKSEFNQTPNPIFTGLVARKFVSILLEAQPICEKLMAIKKESGEEAIPEDELDHLYKLQMALQLYPVEEVGNLIDIDYMEANGVEVCRHRLGRQAIAMLLEKNPDKSFENVYLAFEALEKVGMKDAYVKNVEANLDNIVKYAENGQTRAYDLVRKACEFKKAAGGDASALENVLEKAGIQA